MRVYKHRILKICLGISFICLIFSETACIRYENKAELFENTMNEKTVEHKVCEKKADPIRACHANRVYVINIVNRVDVSSGAGAESRADIVNEIDLIENTVNINLSK